LFKDSDGWCGVDADARLAAVVDVVVTGERTGGLGQEIDQKAVKQTVYQN